MSNRRAMPSQSQLRQQQIQQQQMRQQQQLRVQPAPPMPHQTVIPLTSNVASMYVNPQNPAVVQTSVGAKTPIEILNMHQESIEKLTSDFDSVIQELSSKFNELSANYDMLYEKVCNMEKNNVQQPQMQSLATSIDNTEYLQKINSFLMDVNLNLANQRAFYDQQIAQANNEVALLRSELLILHEEVDKLKNSKCSDECEVLEETNDDEQTQTTIQPLDM